MIDFLDIPRRAWSNGGAPFSSYACRALTSRRTPVFGVVEHPPQPGDSISRLLEVCSWLLLPQNSEPFIKESGGDQLMHAQDQCDLRDTLAVYAGEGGEEILNLAQGAQLLGSPLMVFHLLTVVS